ncbi:MurR/RpiR family transcriptional regulator [Caproicibacter sp.]|uniref:MurR/RpiR family transcriptional regulator n=1 Tax=Caproicibacter sp. TaxID=2814884 RepID=UPI0039899BA7
MNRPVAIIDRIRSIYASLRPSEQKVADFALKNFDGFTLLSIMELSKSADVSQPTVIRFARALGFKGYRELKRSVSLEKKHSGDSEKTFDALAGFDLQPWDSIASIPLKAVQVTKSLLDDTLKSVSADELKKAVHLLVNASLIDIYCVENSFTPASDLLNKLTYLGLACRLNCDSYLQQISAGHLGPQDVGIAFSFSGSSNDTIKALRQAKKSGAATIAIVKEPLI